MKNFNCRMSSIVGNCLENPELDEKCDSKCILFGQCLNCFYNLIHGNKSEVCEECRGVECDK